MKIYKLTREGRRIAKIPGPNRDAVLDHIYEFKTATFDELLIVDKDARNKLREYKSKGYVEELDGT